MQKIFLSSFSYKKDVIQKVNDYTYLGIKKNKVHWKLCFGRRDSERKKLYEHFMPLKDLNFSMLRPKIAEKLFDTLVKPIVLYNSEVWGAYSKGDFGAWDKSPADKVYLRFCKIYLGVNSKCSNDACRADLGRMPLN